MTADTSLTEFLLARISEDEARATSRARVATCDPPGEPLDGCDDLYVKPFDCHHTNLGDLAECDAKRQIVYQAGNAHMMAAQHDSTLGDKFIWEYAQGTLSLMALPYADHPDYRDEWKP